MPRTAWLRKCQMASLLEAIAKITQKDRLKPHDHG